MVNRRADEPTIGFVSDTSQATQFARSVPDFVLAGRFADMVKLDMHALEQEMGFSIGRSPSWCGVVAVSAAVIAVNGDRPRSADLDHADLSVPEGEGFGGQTITFVALPGLCRPLDLSTATPAPPGAGAACATTRGIATLTAAGA